jgi:7-cyano-7-deazaguanine synthase
MDSTVALAWAKTSVRSVLALTVNYGQPHTVEIDQARAIANELEVDHEVVKVPVLGSTGGPVTPGRNMILLSVAAHYAAIESKTPQIVIGACAADAELFPDCREGFFIAARAALSLGVGRAVAVYTPLIDLTKEAIFAKAEKLGVLPTVLEKSHTCYIGDRTKRHAWGYGCGACLACLTRARGWECRKMTVEGSADAST